MTWQAEARTHGHDKEKSQSTEADSSSTQLLELADKIVINVYHMFKNQEEVLARDVEETKKPKLNFQR